ncbi:MAG: carbohydrate kinase family protein [Fidelibacterota bacterium]
MKQSDIICVGEILVDLISEEAGIFRQYPGGAPANVAIGLARLGQAVSFTGRVGDDSFGRFLRQHLEMASVGTDGVTTDRDRQTRLAFVRLDEQGERSFEFFGKHPADLALTAADILATILKRAKVIHFGSLALTDPQSRREFERIIEKAGTGSLISFDPNYRSSLWRSEKDAFKVLNSFASKAQILKMNIEEAKFLCNCDDLGEVLETLDVAATQIIAITLGKEGCVLKTGNFTVKIPGFRVNAVDTTGCGDAFMAALIDGILNLGKKPEILSRDDLYTIGHRANAAGALTAMRFGAMSGLPTRCELEEFLTTETE